MFQACQYWQNCVVGKWLQPSSAQRVESWFDPVHGSSFVQWKSPYLLLMQQMCQRFSSRACILEESAGLSLTYTVFCDVQRSQNNRRSFWTPKISPPYQGRSATFLFVPWQRIPLFCCCFSEASQLSNKEQFHLWADWNENWRLIRNRFGDRGNEQVAFFQDFHSPFTLVQRCKLNI